MMNRDCPFFCSFSASLFLLFALSDGAPVDHTIQECVQNFGEAPRELPLWDRLSYLRVSKPPWLRKNPADEMTTHFKHLKTLFVDGMVTWGHVIQANAQLFQDGPHDCPGELVYSIEDHNRADPAYLQRVAGELYRLKGTKPSDPELQPIAHYLTNEMIRVFGLPVPYAVSPSIKCRISTTFFVRKHLPGHRLCSTWLPIIVNPREPHTVTPLPEKYWPQELIERWQN